MAFSLEAAIITPVAAVLIVTSLALGGKETSDTVRRSAEAEDALMENHFRRSGAIIPDRIIIIETADLMIDMYGTIKDRLFISGILESVE